MPADIVKFLESEPEVAPLIRRIRGGYLKIQGTWMPFEVRAAGTFHHAAADIFSDRREIVTPVCYVPQKMN